MVIFTVTGQHKVVEYGLRNRFLFQKKWNAQILFIQFIYLCIFRSMKTFNTSRPIWQSHHLLVCSLRIAPVSFYDWLIIVSAFLYIVYFVDVVGRASGWRHCSRRNVKKTEIEMEGPSAIEPGKDVSRDINKTIIIAKIMVVTIFLPCTNIHAA